MRCLALLVFLMTSAAAQDAKSAVEASLPKELPLGLGRSEYQIPPYPLTPGWVALGKRIFFDPILSIDKTVSCSSCHLPEYGFAHPDPLPLGVKGRRAKRHSPSLINRAFGTAHRWDGKANTLEDQVVMPISDPNEMDLSLADALKRLADDAKYRKEFSALGVEAIEKAQLQRALGSYLRTLIVGDSVIDRFRAAQVAEVSTLEKTGLWIYESKGKCWKCHGGGNFSDEKFHNTGVGVKGGLAAPGRFSVTGEVVDRGRFKTPTLRGLVLTAPYMHDGSLKTLEDVVEFYRRGGHANDNLDAKIEKLDLTDHQAKALVAFLKALSRKSSAKTRK